MSRIKLVLLSLVATVAVSAAAVGSASAAPEYKKAGTGIAAAQEIVGTVGVAQLTGKIAGVKMLIECTVNTISGSIEPAGKSKGEITYKSCTLFEIKNGAKTSLAAKCVLKEPINFKFTDLLLAGPGGLVEDEFSPEVGETFVTIKIENNGAEVCALKGNFEAKGKYVASGGDEIERELTTHELVYTSTGSKVKLGPEPASYTDNVKIKLKSGEAFYAE